MEKKLPIYKMTINDGDESGVSFVALVDEPAIERNWFAFSKQKEFKFQADNERRIITGPLMIADLPIYRNNPKMGEFYVTFDAPTIERIVQKYFKNHNTSNVNMMHDENRQVQGVYMFESFMIDPERGIKAPSWCEGITPGSWIGSYKIDNDEVWENFIKTGEFKGFSVEGLFDMEIDEETTEDKIVKEIDEILNSYMVNK